MDKIETVLRGIEEFGRDNFMFNIPRETGIFLHLLVKIMKPKKILEVGTSNGYSTIWLGREGNKVITVEENKIKARMAKKNFENAGLKNIKLVEGDALKVLEKLKEKFDFVFIDARKKDYLKYLKKINVKGIVIADNILSHKEDLVDYVGYVRKNYDSSLIEIGTGVEVSIVR